MNFHYSCLKSKITALNLQFVKFAIIVMTMLSYPTGVTFVLCVVNRTCNTVPLVVSILEQTHMTYLIRRLIINMLSAINFDVNCFTVRLEMLIVRDGVIGLQSDLYIDEIDLIINPHVTRHVILTLKTRAAVTIQNTIILSLLTFHKKHTLLTKIFKLKGSQIIATRSVNPYIIHYNHQSNLPLMSFIRSQFRVILYNNNLARCSYRLLYVTVHDSPSWFHE